MTARTARFEKGDLKTLGKITSKASNLEPEFTIWIIQPGLSKSKTSIEQLRLLASTELYLKETSDIPLSGSLRARERIGPGQRSK